MRQPIIGSHIEALGSNNALLAKGEVAEETKKTLLVMTANGLKRIQKKGCLIKITDGEKAKKITIKGSTLMGAPADRIRRKQ